jgi:hypothetical protein
MTEKVTMLPQGADKTEAMKKIEDYLRMCLQLHHDGLASPWVKWKKLSEVAGLSKGGSVQVREAISLLVRVHGARIVTHPQHGYCWAYNVGLVDKDIERLQGRILVMQSRLSALQNVKALMEAER